MGFGSIVGKIAGSVGGKLIGDLLGGDDDSASDAARAAAAQFRPYNVNSPFGWSNYDPATGTLNFGLNPRQQALHQQWIDESRGGIAQKTQRLYNQMQRIAAPGERDLRRQTKEGLYSMGALGTHSGREMVGEVEDAIQRARLNRAWEARSQAYNERQGAFNNYLNLSTMQLGAIGPLTVNRNPAAGVVASGMINAGVAEQARANQFGASIGNQVGGAIADFNWSGAWDRVSSIFSPAATNPYTVSGSGLYGPGGSGGFYGAF